MCNEFRVSVFMGVDTLVAAAEARHALGFDANMRFEHHLTEASGSVVREPYDRRTGAVAAVAAVPDLSARHGGAAQCRRRDHPRDILDNFITKDQVVVGGLMPLLERDCLDKHASLHETTAALTRAGIGVRPAALLHAPSLVAAPA
jgi:hypothetical protein